MGKQWLTLFWGAPKSLQMVTAAMMLKDAYSLEGKLWPIYFFYYFLTLQYCIGFAIYQHESATGIHVFHPEPSSLFPLINFKTSLSVSIRNHSGLSQCTSPKHPVSCIEPGLATHFIYDIIHVSMPFSQIIPPSPSPTESTRLFYTSACCF